MTPRSTQLVTTHTTGGPKVEKVLPLAHGAHGLIHISFTLFTFLHFQQKQKKTKRELNIMPLCNEGLCSRSTTDSTKIYKINNLNPVSKV
ncbi:hypothetical protein L873DRAFT_1814085 [Choiromyces venosus 120613-1]|uniref:Uncharacterized protein n=1 Tax=Choiromyces venosus 120613-1 TaxID=1336337 RepID=A0A3N4JB72_9PEZI|nr:hypothetical protein L873DRAFT_1814085 [Choiromyces venosus 120613-1]